MIDTPDPLRQIFPLLWDPSPPTYIYGLYMYGPLMKFGFFFCKSFFWDGVWLSLSRRKSLSYRNHSIDLLCKSMDWFLYDRDLHPERVIPVFPNDFNKMRIVCNIHSYWLNAFISSRHDHEVFYLQNIHFKIASLCLDVFLIKRICPCVLRKFVKKCVF